MGKRLQYIEQVEGLFKPLGAYTFASIDSVTGEVKTAGQVANDETNKIVEGGIEAQTHQVMNNLLRILGAAATDLSNVSRAYVCLRYESDAAAVNEVYSRYFKDDMVPPPRVAIEGSPPLKGALVEIYMDAVLPIDSIPTQ